MIKIVKEIFKSNLLQREISYKVILPENYDFSEEKFPVIYLLHGLFGNADNWLELTDLKKYLRQKGFVTVLPEGYNNWYSDSATIECDKFESSFINELIPFVEAKFKVSDRREKRSIAGLSMGGFGALKFALKRPDLFVFAGSMSGALDAPRIYEANKYSEWNDLRQSVWEVFGSKNDSSRIENDLFELVERMTEKQIISIPRLHIDCGTDDIFLAINRDFSRILSDKKIPYEYFEMSGGHDWAYWNRQIKKILTIAQEVFYKQKT